MRVPPKTRTGKSQIAKLQAEADREFLERTFEHQLKANKLAAGWVAEHEFHDTRKWRFDFAHLGRRIAVEIEGGTKGGRSRHSKGDGFEKDAEKYNTAVALGWTLFRFTARMVTSGNAILFIERYLKGEIA